MVIDAVAASFFFESGQLRECWGDDPPAHLPKAVQLLIRTENLARQKDREAKNPTEDRP